MASVVTASSPAPSGDQRVLFCPFCRESYEGETHCPAHELLLVEFHKLPKQAHERKIPGWDERLPVWEWRYGRGILAAGAVLACIGFVLPFASGHTYDHATMWTGLNAATRRIPGLWSVPIAGVAALVLLGRRRTLREMLGARLGLLLVALAPVLSIVHSLHRMFQGVAATQGAMRLHVDMGPYVIGVASLIMVIGSWRLGRIHVDALPHGASPAGDAGASAQSDSEG